MVPEVAFGKILRQQRLSLGLSQEQLALNCDLDRTFISLLERGQRQPSLTTIIVLSKSLSIAPSKLIQLTMDLVNENYI
ncbi:TPA: helix-turn-helix domain-containing protein [Serratia fonticola]